MGKILNNNSSMKDNHTCEDVNFQIPCELLSRVRQYASANKIDLTNVVIEALDKFLRDRKD